MAYLPSHLAIGRTALSGPVTGNYAVFNLGPFSVAAGASDTDDAGAHFHFIAPFDCRLQRISWNARAVVANSTLKAFKNTTLTTVGATALLTTNAVDLDVNSVSYAEAASGGADTLVEAARDITKGTVVFVTTPRADTNGSLTDLTVSIVVTVMGFCSTDPARD